jgi:hypothetical protein
LAGKGLQNRQYPRLQTHTPLRPPDKTDRRVDVEVIDPEFRWADALE